MSDAILTVGVSCGHGGPRHSKACASGGRCRACGTKAGIKHGLDVEAVITRALGERLMEVLPYVGCQPVPLNAARETVTPPTRGARAREAGCDLVVAVHINESPSHGAHGAHLFHRTGDRIGLRACRAAAECWPEGLRRQLLPYHSGGMYIAGMVESARGDYWPDAAGCLSAYAPIPTMLVEAFYASNAVDAGIASSMHVQTEMVAAMARGVAAASRAINESTGG